MSDTPRNASPKQPARREAGRRVAAWVRKLRHAVSGLFAPSPGQPWAPEGRLVPIPVRTQDR
ncbi:MAG TPA: hypothetical protein PK879_03325 [Opitutaceae bacterium]|nr:hypothetical protein [Opitutaceae bacterium]HOY53254.1 hypothetical protein [Opitutaceae bacterium]HPG16980.1 hypothetical protein [Opitutaceae bacterium]HPN99719.1 hypothetical protein [Opitutaceae bacterium]